VTSALLDDLRLRGLFQDSTDPGELTRHLDDGSRTVYCGFDPTAPSLHLGNLVPLLMLRRFQLAGHRPIALAGGATGMIGDPGGRSDERNLLDAGTLAENSESISGQLRRFLDFDDPVNGALLVDNRAWTAPLGVLDFLRDVGKHITVNSMLARESVRSRIESEHGISFTEFSYMLLQANDFFVLNDEHDCTLQVSGSDQWGNITAGIELVRKRAGRHVHGLTSPLLTRADGTKYGKSVSGALWLDPAHTSPYELYQFLFGSEDADVARLLFALTLEPSSNIGEVVSNHLQAPHERTAQRLLARSLVGLIHGLEVLGPIEQAQHVLFGGELGDAGPAAYELLAREIPSTNDSIARWTTGRDALEVFVEAGLAKSKGEMRRNLAGYRVNGAPASERLLTPDDARHGRFVLLQRGRAAHHLVCLN